MKNIIKKVSAFAMAFTLLGAGTAIAKEIAPSSDTTLTASAITYANEWRERDTFHDVRVYEFDGQMHRYTANGPNEFGTISIGYKYSTNGRKPIDTIKIETWTTANGRRQRTSVKYVDAHWWQISW